MKTRTYYYLTLLVASIMLGFTACGDDDPVKPVEPEPEPQPVENPDTTKTDPEPEPEPVGSPTVGWPAEYGGVMLQAFYWDGFDDAQWIELESHADEMAGTFDLVWLPQSGNCGGKSMGYDDLYWFSNYNSSFGTEAQLRSLISTFKAKGIKTIADVVINHRRNVSNWVDFPKETYKGVTYEMKSTDIVKNDDGGATLNWATQNGYQLSAYNDTGEGWDGMRDLDHRSENVQTSVKAYLNFLRNDLGYAGFRYDMVKGYSPSYTGMYNAASQPEFSVGECWDSSNTIRNWIDGTKVDGIIQSAAFDFQFKYVVRNATDKQAWNFLNGQNDGNWPLVSNNYEQGKYRRYAVTFVENHDTEVRPDGSSNGPLRKDTLAANAFLMAMPGTPCVFLKHWLTYPAEIKTMVAARKEAGINNESGYQPFRTGTKYYSFVTTTKNENRLLTVVGDLSAVESNIDAQQWTKVTQGYHYAYYFPTTMNKAYVDLPSGKYEGIQHVMLSAVTTTDGAKVVYTTDGSTPTAASAAVATGTLVDIPVGTTTLKAAILAGGQVGDVITRTYDVKESEKDKPVEIPSFCTVAQGETCAFFEAPNSWNETIYCWAWDTQNYTGGNWPGQACQKLGTSPSNGNSVWKWTYSGTLTTRPSSIIFSSNGAPQTADFSFQNGGYYNKDGLKGVVEPK
ncbi:MAG: starch-binding protein [Prevotella sp.]|nr:starch-binding protein [Prevotella sp.]